MKLIFSFVLLMACMAVKAGTPPQAPAVFALNGNTLQMNKERIAKKDPLLLPAYKKLLKDADKALLEGPFSVMEKKNDPPSGDKHDYMSLAPYFWPDPSKPGGLPYMRKDGQTNPEVKEYKDKEYMPRLCGLVQTLGLAYYFSGEEKYASHAARLLRVWFLDPATKMNPNLRYAQAIKGENDGRGAGLIDSRHFILLVDAIGLIQSSASWKQVDQDGMKQWFAEFLNWMQTSKNGLSEMKTQNNHGTWYDAQCLALALFIDSTELAKKIINNTKARLEQQMDNEGKFPKEMERTTSLHYSLFDLEAFFLVASMAEKKGIDLWHYETPLGKSLKKGFDFLVPYLTKQKKWTGQQIKDFDFEEGYYVLMTGALKYNCGQCKDAVAVIAADKATAERTYLLF